ncbi:MAG: hypothetical protein ABIN79_03435 [Marmoricola sp.]
MTTNVSFALLDAAVIGGRGDEPALGRMTHARLLEEVAAVGGVLRAFGVTPAAPVLIDLADDEDAVVAALAVARVGGLVTTEDRPDALVVLVDEGSTVPAGRPRVVRGDDVREPDLEWGLMIRAGRTDPAACAEMSAGAAYSAGRSVGEQIEVLASAHPPYDAAHLRRLLQV